MRLAATCLVVQQKRQEKGKNVARRSKKTISKRTSLEPQRRENALKVSLVTGLFLVGLAVYLTLFYRNEVVAGIFGYQRLAFLLLPDQLVAGWCGGELGKVQVLDRVGPLLVTIVIWAVAGLLGWLVLDLLRVGPSIDRQRRDHQRLAHQRLDYLELSVLAIGVGLSGVSVFTLAIGLAGGLRQPIWFILLGVTLLVAVLWRGWRRVAGPTPNETLDSRDLKSTVASTTVASMTVASTTVASMTVASTKPTDAAVTAAQPWWRPRWWWAAVPFAWVILAGGVLPPLHFDVLEYHLQVPKQWYQQGQVTFLPYNIYGNMPLGAEILAAQAMALMPGELSWWWGGLAGKLIVASYALLTTALVFVAGRRLFSERAGVIASLLYISTAWVALVALNGLNESVVAYYLLASFYVGKLWWDRRCVGAQPQWGLLVLTGLLTGSAVACKYTSVLFVLVPMFLMVALGSRVYRVRATLLFLLAVTATCGLWFGKNWVLTGNPTYPLLVNVFGGATRTPEKDAQWRRAHQVPRDASGDRYSVSQAQEAAVDLLGGNVWQNPLLVPFAALLVLRRRRRAVAYWIVMLAFVLAAWWVATHRLDRFWVPAIPLMALLAGVGATWSDAFVWRRTVTVVLALGLMANFIYIVAPVPSLADNRYLVSLTELRDAPQLVLNPGSYQQLAFAYLREHVPPDAKVLIVGDAAVFNLRVPALYNTCFDDSVFDTVFRGRGVDERRRHLAELGISHVYIDWAELRRYRQPGNYGYSPYVTRVLVHGELVAQQKLLRRVDVPGLDPEQAELFVVE